MVGGTVGYPAWQKFCCVLGMGSQVFGQALIKSCELRQTKKNKKKTALISTKLGQSKIVHRIESDHIILDSDNSFH